MVGKAKSVALKAAIYAKQKDDLMAHAVQLYSSQSTDNTQAMGKTLSLRAVCTSVSNDYFTKTNIQIFLYHKTLSQLCQGGTTRTESNKKKSWLMESEQDIIVEYAIDIAHRGFPLSPKRLREHAEMILRARLGKKFPEKGLSKNWATQFITKHHKKLGTYWSSSLDSSRARAVNPHTKEEYYAMLKKVREDFDICDELIYGADETSIQTGIGVTERVIGPAGAKIQHQQRSGNRENITVLPTICADGTSTPPTVIYKGESFQAKWLQENPLNARFVMNLFS